VIVFFYPFSTMFLSCSVLLNEQEVPEERRRATTKQAKLTKTQKMIRKLKKKRVSVNTDI